MQQELEQRVMTVQTPHFECSIAAFGLDGCGWNADDCRRGFCSFLGLGKRGGKGEMDTSCVGKPYFELCHLKVIPMLIFLGSVVVNLCGVQR